MRMSRLALVCAVFVMAGSSEARAQTRLGLGIGIATGVVGGDLFSILESAFTPVSIYIPLTSPTFRVEPEIGLFRASENDGEDESKTTALQLGVGVFAMKTSGNTNAYWGGRVGITRVSQSESFGPGTIEASVVNIFLGPALGGEYVFGGGFSLGGEAQLLYTKLGQDDDAPDDASASTLRTRAVFFVRWRP